MSLGKCYHKNGKEMEDNYQVEYFSELTELLSEVCRENVNTNTSISA